MSYNVFTIPPFDKQLKQLAKKYPSIKDDFVALVNSLELNPKQGTLLVKNCFKIRLAITSKQKGKRSGARVITNFTISENAVFLLTIYDKSEKANITDKELISLLKFLEV